MIDSKIIKIASYTENVGLRNKFTHKSSIKNSLCGDFIKTEFIADKLKVKSMRYETESCLLCEASASLFSRKIKNFKIRDLIKEIKELKKSNNTSSYSFSNKLKEFDRLINKKNINRFNCVTLPMEAFLKAFKMK
jgi:NifU-like protein involved in Fe-S cluster formation